MSLITAATLLVALASQPASITVVDAEGMPLQDAVLVQFSADVNAPAEPREHLMEQVSRQFSPQLLVIASGDTVSFPNNDSVRHHVYSFSRPRTFEFELFSAGEAPGLDFPEQGVVVVGCNIHDQMEGYIIIGAGAYARSNEHGEIQLPDDFSDNGEWYVWHSWMLSAGQQPAQFSMPDQTLQLNVTRPEQTRTSELESRFRSRALRGGH